MALIFKPFVARYSIEVAALIRADEFALILGKVAAVLDQSQEKYCFGPTEGRADRAQDACYCVAVFVFGLSERTLEQGTKRAACAEVLIMCPCQLRFRSRSW